MLAEKIAEEILVKAVEDAFYSCALEWAWTSDPDVLVECFEREIRRIAKEHVPALRKAIEEAEKEQQTPSLGEKLGIVRTDSDFDFDKNSQTHIPKLTLYFEAVPVNAPYHSKGWDDRDTAAALLAAPERKID